MASRTLVLQVHGPHGVVKPIAFDKRPLAEQVQGICDEFGLSSDESNFLLTRGASAETPPIRSKAELLALPEQTEIGLHTGTDVTQARLSAIQNTSALDVAAEFQHLSASLHANGGLAEEFVAAGGMRTIREKIVGHANSPGMENMEPAAACLCELLHYAATTEWLDEHQEGLDSEFFSQFFATLFPANNTSEQWNKPRRSPHASLSVFLFLLQRFPKCAAACHEAAEGPVYQQIQDSIANATDEFQVSAAVSVVGALVRASSSDELLQQRICTRLLQRAGDADEVLRSILESDGRDDRYTDQLLFMCMDACTELSAERAGGEDCDRLRQEIQRLRQKQERFKSTEAMLRNELRKSRRALKVMVDFVKVDGCLMVERNLPAIVKHGWNTIQWKGGYNMLHLVCECADDPKIVELVAAFAPDLERPDDVKGLRPIDYARQNKRPEIKAAMEKLRRQNVARPQLTQQTTKDNLAPVLPDMSSLRQRYAKLEGVSDKLKLAIGAVLDKGFQGIRWPKGFTAIHFAAMEGHVGAVELLASARADVNAKDDFGSKPIDYALKGNHMAVTDALDKLMSAAAAASEAQGGSMPVLTNRPRRRLSSIDASGEELDDQKLASLLDAMPPHFREMCSAVAKSGWRAFRWKQDFTSLHMAAQAGSAEAVQFLLHAKASPALDLQDERGLTPLGYAKQHNHENVIAILSPLSRPDNSSSTPVTPETPETPATPATPAMSQVLEEPATPSEPADPEPETPVQPSTTVDATTESSLVQRREEHQKKLDEVLAELERLKAEKADLLDERQKRKESLPALTTFVAENKVLEYVVHLQSFGREAVFAKLQEDRPSGGLALPEEDATRVAKQLELIERIHTELSAEKESTKKQHPTPGKLAEVVTDSPLGNPSEQPSEEAAPQASSPPPGPPSTTSKGAGKGSKKGKAPAPPPKGKGQATTRTQPSREKVSTRVPMKPIWLSRYLMGVHLKADEDDSIWFAVNDAKDLVPKDELEDRFAKNASAFVVTDVSNEGSGEKAKKDKYVRIITDPQLLGAKQAALRRFPNADSTCQAIIELDETVISLDGLRDLIQHACPEPGQVEQLKKAREANPTLPLALPEHFMWKISEIPAYKARLDCWIFARTLEDRTAHLMQGLRKFAAIADACRDSKALSSFLSLALAFANYCNADSEDRGQADGFDLKGIHNFANVKDASGKDLRHLMLKVYLNKMRAEAEQLFSDFRPLFDNVYRSIQRDADGAEQLSKKVDVKIEDYDQEVVVLNDEFEQSNAKMRMLMQYIEDPADQCVLQMPRFFEKAEKSVKELVEQRDSTKQKYSGLLKWLKISAMNSEDFCLLWDDFFAPETLFIAKPKSFKKDFLEPAFCQIASSESFQPMGVESLLVLWGFQSMPVQKPPSLQMRGTASQRGGKLVRRFGKKKSLPKHEAWDKVRTSLAIVAALRGRKSANEDA